MHCLSYIADKFFFACFATHRERGRGLRRTDCKNLSIPIPKLDLFAREEMRKPEETLQCGAPYRFRLANSTVTAKLLSAKASTN